MRKNRSIYSYREYHTTDQFIFSIIFGVQYMHYCVVLLCEVYSRTSTNGHLFTTATFFCPGGQSIHSLCTDVPPPSEKNREKRLFFRFFSAGGETSVHRLSIHCIHTTATTPQRQQLVFSETDEKVKNIHEI